MLSTVYKRPRSVFTSDAEEHTRFRRMLSKPFTFKRVEGLRPAIQQVTDECIDAILAGPQPADIVSKLALPVPTRVISEMLGVPYEDHEFFQHHANVGLARYATAEDGQKGVMGLAQYLINLVKAKMESPSEDAVSDLAERVNAGEISVKEAAQLGTGLLIAGHETTANMIGKMVSMLLAERSRWEQVVADPSLIRSAVEESLRFDANLGLGMARYLLEDVDVAGEILPQGTTVMTNMSSANRDERTFTGAETMDLTRSPNPHITFGAGPHSCLGQALARTELQTALRVLTRRLPTLELDVDAEQLRRLEGLLVGGLEQIPVRW
jgi:cytochrome P450